MRILLLLAAIAVLIWGWFLMKKLDDFLEHRWQAQDPHMQSGNDMLRIGFANPLVADSITGVLERYAKIHPNISVCLLHGSQEHLIKELSASKVDVIFLPENIDAPFRVRYHVRKILLSYTPVMMKYGGLPIEPISDGNITQTILWSKNIHAPFVHDFMECINQEFDAAEAKK